jgi:hypothetical protein
VFRIHYSRSLSHVFAGHFFQSDPRTRQTGKALAPFPAHIACRRHIVVYPLARGRFPPAQAERHSLMCPKKRPAPRPQRRQLTNCMKITAELRPMYISMTLLMIDKSSLIHYVLSTLNGRSGQHVVATSFMFLFWLAPRGLMLLHIFNWSIRSSVGEKRRVTEILRAAGNTCTTSRIKKKLNEAETRPLRSGRDRGS